jgi:hypothetical protein
MACGGGSNLSAGEHPQEWNKTRDLKARLVKEHVMSRWENTSAIQIDFQLFVQFEDGRRVHLYTDKKPRCFLRAALLNPSRVLVQGCSRTFVADLGGVVQYKLHKSRYFAT